MAFIWGCPPMMLWYSVDPHPAWDGVSSLPPKRTNHIGSEPHHQNIMCHSLFLGHSFKTLHWSLLFQHITLFLFWGWDKWFSLHPYQSLGLQCSRIHLLCSSQPQYLNITLLVRKKKTIYEGVTIDACGLRNTVVVWMVPTCILGEFSFKIGILEIFLF